MSDPVANCGPLAMTTRRSGPLILVLVSLVLVSLAASQTSAGPSDTPEANLGKGYDALKQDRYDVAVDEFRAALKLDPSLILRARFPLAVALFEMHRPDEARREFEAVRHKAGDHPNVSYYLGRLDIDVRDFEGAIRNLSAALVKPPFRTPLTTWDLPTSKRANWPTQKNGPKKRPKRIRPKREVHTSRVLS